MGIMTRKSLNTVLGLLTCMVFFLVPAISEAAGDVVLVIRVGGEDFEQAVKGLITEFEDEFSVSEMVIDKKTRQSNIRKRVSADNPKIVVLMDNIAISKFKRYQMESGNVRIPVVCLMASFMDLAIKGMQNATGIHYDVPIVTSAVYLRSVLDDAPLSKIGVLHREFMTGLVETNRVYCEREKIRLVSHSIPNKTDFESEIGRGLRELQRKKIDALWFPNDNILIRNFLVHIWIPHAQEHGRPVFKNPIIVGVENLVRPKSDFGTFAVIPDPVELGAQAAETVFEIMDNDWVIEETEVVPPRSVLKILNMKQARKFGVDKEKLATVNKLLE